MKRLMIATLPLLAALGACGGGSPGDVATTNSGDVVLNDAHENFAFTNDGEQSNSSAPAGGDMGMNSTDTMSDNTAMTGNTM